MLIERFWNKFHYHENIGIGGICAHSLNKAVVEKKMSFSAFGFIKTLLFQILLLCQKRKSPFSKILILLPNFSDRALSQIEPIQKVMSSGQYSSLLVTDFYKYGNFQSFFKWFFQTVLNSRKYFNAVYSIKEITSQSNLFYTILIQTLRYQLAFDILKKSEIKFILVDLDRSAFNSPVICAANNLNIENATLIHGMVFPPNLFIPILSKKIYCWGSFHEFYFKNLSKTNTTYFVSGNPSFKLNFNEVKSNNDIKIVFVSQNFGDNLQLRWLEKIFSISQNIPVNVTIYIKAHPADNFEIFKNLTNEKIVLLSESYTVEETLELADLFLVMSSTFAFEAIFNSKPVVFLSSPDNRIELAELFKNESESKIVFNEVELKTLIRRISVEGVTKVVALKKQTEFATRFCKYSSIDAALIIKNDILLSIEKSN